MPLIHPQALDGSIAVRIWHINLNHKCDQNSVLITYLINLGSAIV